MTATLPAHTDFGPRLREIARGVATELDTPDPRTLGELFSYCGVAGPEQQRRRGHKSVFNPAAKKRIHIIADAAFRLDGKPDKNGRARALSPYRVIYDEARLKYTGKIHTAPCSQCGKSGPAAEIGTPWVDGHQHKGALRIVKREILRDLWTESRRLHNAGSNS